MIRTPILVFAATEVGMRLPSETDDIFLFDHYHDRLSRVLIVTVRHQPVSIPARLV